MEEQPAAGFNLKNKKTLISLVGVVLLLIAIPAAAYLAQQKQIFKPKAAEINVNANPETSFTLDINKPSPIQLGDEVKVSIVAKSDLEAANLFAAKLHFPKDLIQVKKIEVTPEGGFVKNWVETNYDNDNGTVDAVGGVPSPGYKSDFDPTKGSGYQGALMADIVFSTIATGSATISFDSEAAIYSDSNNANILTVKREVSFQISKIDTTITPTPIPAGSCGLGMYIKFQDITTNGPELKYVSLSLKKPGTNEELWKFDSVPASNKDTYPYTNTKGDLYRIGIGGVNCGTYDVYVNSSGYQEKKFSNILVDGDMLNDPETYIFNGSLVPTGSKSTSTITPTVTPTPTPVGIKGDINNDGKIGLVDISVLLSKWGKTGVDAGKADTNGDGFINSVDYSLMINILIENKVIKTAAEAPKP